MSTLGQKCSCKQRIHGFVGLISSIRSRQQRRILNADVSVSRLFFICLMILGVDCVRNKVNCRESMQEAATSPLKYVVAFQQGSSRHVHVYVQ